MAAQIQQVSASLSGASQSTASTAMANAQGSLYVGGTFTGTVQAQARPTGGSDAFVPVIPAGASTADVTAPACLELPFLSGDWEYKVVMTAFTSGTANVQLNLAPRI